MRLKFIFLGRTKEKYLATGIRDYLSRIEPYMPVEEILIKATKAADSQAATIRVDDTRKVLAAVRTDDVFVLLDPGGRELTSPELARWIKDKQEHGLKTIAFGLGGPQGLDESAAHRADLKLCLSRLTLTHEMSRLVLAEQVYRAVRIIAGHPYHK